MTSTTSSILSDESGSLLYGEDYVISHSEEEEQQLSWRLDPEESHSDWTILVHVLSTDGTARSDSTDTSTMYHVHKNILAVGPWKSDYFTALFRTTQCSEVASRTSTIELEELAAEAMPFMLDFMYQHHLTLTTEHAVALRYLSKYFGVKLLYKQVMEYLKGDMKLSTLGVYVSHARVFDDEAILSLAASQCVDRLAEMNQELLLKAMDPMFLVRILSNPDVDTCSDSYLLSTIVAKYCSIHQDSLDQATFLQLTDRNYTPLIDKDAALPLLTTEAKLFGEDTRDNEPDASVSVIILERPSSPSDPSMSCLQKRCIHRLALSWSNLSNSSQLASLQQLSPSLLAKLLQQACTVAKEANDKISEEWHRDVLKLRLDQENIVCGAIESEIHLKHHAERIQTESKEKISHLRSLLAERDRQIRVFQSEWDKMIRLPTEHSFNDESLHTYHHLSGNEPFDHQRSVNRFGRVRPTSMPKIGSSSENGVLVVEQEGNNTYKRWPVFYYKGD